MTSPTRRIALGFLAALIAFALLPNLAQADEVDDLIAVLQSGADPYDKEVACRRLAVVGTPKAAEALAALLGDEQLATSARTALDAIEGPEAAAALRGSLTRLTGVSLVGVIESLGTRGDVEAVPALGRIVRSTDQTAASAAAHALGRIGGRDAAAALVAALPVADGPVRAAIGLGCIACGDGLAAAGDARVALRLVDAVRRPDMPSAVVAAATYRSILWQGQGGARLLVRHLHSDDPELYGAALQLVRDMPGEPVTRAICSALDSVPTHVRVLLIGALGHRGDVAAMPAVSEVALSGPTEARVAACRTLAQIGDASAVSTLLAAAIAPDESVSTAAVNALAALQADGVDAAVVARLGDPSAETRQAAIRVAGQRRIAAAIPALIEAVAAQGETRSAAIRALGQTCGPDRLPDLVATLTGLSSEEEVRLAEAAVSDTASRIEDKQTVADALVGGLAAAPATPKAALLRLLKAAPVSSALGALRAALGDGAVADTAYAVLGDWPTPEAAPDLLALAKAGGDRRDLGLRGYIRLIGSSALSPEEKMAMCTEAAALVANDGERDQLLGALATVPTVEALDMAMSHLDNPALTARVCWAAVTIAEPLEQSHPARVVDALTRVLEVMDNPNMERRVRSSRDRAAEAAGS